MKQIIVTVGREHGSGGKYIAEQIAKQLGIAFYDKELLLASVFNAEDAARYDEKPVHLLWSRRIGENFNAPEDALAHETFEHIQELADSGESFVVLGRCADYALKDRDDVINLFITAPLENRIKRVAARNGISENEAKDRIKKTDKSRASYYNYYSTKDWGDAKSYDLCIDSSLLGIDGTVELLKDLIRIKGIK